jgi:tetratricopeptide (TPR) repeat protein
MRGRSLFFEAAILLLSFAPFSTAHAQTTDAEFEQAVKAYQHMPYHQSAKEAAKKVVRLAMAMPELPPIPEEARRHFARGAELAREARTPDEMEQVMDEFQQAARLAPWWPDARYNLALTTEAAGEYDSAISNLEIYMLFKLPDADLRAAQDKIYALQVKQERAAGKGASGAAACAAPKAVAPSAAPNRGRVGKLHFSFDFSAGPYVRTMSGTIEDVEGMWNALLPLQPPPCARGGYGLIGDDQLLGHEPGYGLKQLGLIARKYIKFDRIHVEQPSGWESIGVPPGVFTKANKMNDATLGWAFFDLRGNFESEMKKLLNIHP